MVLLENAKDLSKITGYMIYMSIRREIW